ncbi:rhamnulokinase [Aeribacillus pallidus]|uniref:rhamnulokinase n=1 Tax=Aeribacillus TaxID=1055323 RepID=UPI0007B4D15B|nr:MULTISPECIES: rhamnulokinase [Aeribacillus]KZM54345.1 rhamnulokinase [Aeribacillus pallidus]MED0649509.1 rhamnulokinase [Aeribacillus composti]MED4486862.1 rhamnulokinase [Aeribacillus pallidus]
MTHIAVDIGASSGRLVIGDIKNGKLTIEEIHRFANGFTERNGTYYWDIDHLLTEIVKGLAYAKTLGVKRCTLGIDTWATDYVLVDQEGKRVQEVIAYRDKRTERTIEKITKHISKKDIYEKTGIQFLSFNTLYQLYEEKKENLEKTKMIMTVPDYLGYKLTGCAVTEVTSASCTQLLNVKEKDFDQDLLQLLSIEREQFPPFSYPGDMLGYVRNEYFPDYDLPETKVIIVGSHDTASAVAGVPAAEKNWAYLSSGTWSLIGIESDTPIITEKSLFYNYTNEWGVFGTYRFLKNIMGMWIIQEVRRHLTKDYNFAQMVDEARKAPPCKQFINFNDQRFFNPDNMVEEIQKYCRETLQPVPQSTGEIARCVFTNLAILYSLSMDEIESISGRTIDSLYIVGGGSQNDFINEMTAAVSGKTVFAGPSEATAVGNILIQLIAEKKLANLQEGRNLVLNSFSIKRFDPRESGNDALKEQFKQAVFSWICTEYRLHKKN